MLLRLLETVASGAPTAFLGTALPTQPAATADIAAGATISTPAAAIDAAGAGSTSGAAEASDEDAANRLAYARLQLQRLLEVLSFMLSHFTTGPESRRMEAVLQGAGQAQAGQGQQGTSSTAAQGAAADTQQGGISGADQSQGDAQQRGEQQQGAHSAEGAATGHVDEPDFLEGMSKEAALAPAAGAWLPFFLVDNVLHMAAACE